MHRRPSYTAKQHVDNGRFVENTRVEPDKRRKNTPSVEKRNFSRLRTRRNLNGSVFISPVTTEPFAFVRTRLSVPLYSVLNCIRIDRNSIWPRPRSVWIPGKYTDLGVHLRVRETRQTRRGRRVIFFSVLYWRKCNWYHLDGDEPNRRRPENIIYVIFSCLFLGFTKTAHQLIKYFLIDEHLRLRYSLLFC